MANKRIKDISTTATSPNADDVCVIDGATAGTRKIAAGPLGGNFDENIVVENGGNKATYASNFLRSENGAYYIDAYTTGGDIIFRTSVASALDTQSMVIDGATGNIGIGSTGGGNKLTVVSAEATTPQVLIQNSTSTGDAGLSFNVSGRTFTMGIDKSDSEKFKISRSSELGNTDYLTIDGGNVGIGGAPSSSLHVYSSTADNLRLERDATNDWRIQLTSGALAFRDATADAERLRLDSSGNVKAGTGTFPVAALAGIQIANGASSYSYFSATDDTKQFAAGIDHTLSEGVVGMISNHGLRVVTNNTERLRVDASGNLAIGTTSASHPLTVTGNSYLIGASSSIIGNNDATNYALSDSSGVLQNKWYGGHEWYTLGSNQRMKLTSDGKLGIGGSPTEKLTVVTFWRHSSDHALRNSLGQWRERERSGLFQCVNCWQCEQFSAI